MKGALVVVALVLTHPAVVHACTTCGATEKGRVAFAWSTAGLSILPLAMIFGVIYWLKKSADKARATPIAPPPAE